MKLGKTLSNFVQVLKVTSRREVLETVSELSTTNASTTGHGALNLHRTLICNNVN